MMLRLFQTANVGSLVRRALYSTSASESESEVTKVATIQLDELGGVASIDFHVEQSVDNVVVVPVKRKDKSLNSEPEHVPVPVAVPTTASVENLDDIVVANRQLVDEMSAGIHQHIVGVDATPASVDDGVDETPKSAAEEAEPDPGDVNVSSVLGDSFVTQNTQWLLQGGVEEVLDPQRAAQALEPVDDIKERELVELRDAMWEAVNERTASGRRRYPKVLKLKNEDDVQGMLSREVEKRTRRSDVSSSFCIVDLSVLARKMEQWARFLPDVRPLYAVKCNPDPMIVRSIAAMGGGADCASPKEIAIALNQGLTPDDIIYANPCKSVEGVQFALKHGVRTMTFDNEAELEKVVKHFGTHARLVLRILGDDSHSEMAFGSKFGATEHESRLLLERAAQLGLDVAGISFHVGSGCRNSQGYASSLDKAQAARELGLSLGHSMTLLDIGGGFPGTDSGDLTFAQIVEPMPKLVYDRFISAGATSAPITQCIAEPGRYFAAETVVLVSPIIAKRRRTASDAARIPRREGSRSAVGEASARVNEQGDTEDSHHVSYYISDGVYGSFNSLFFDHQTVHPQLIGSGADAKTSPSSIYGPSCDSIDVLVENVALPQLEVGQFIFWLNMGAYTNSSLFGRKTHGFNGLPLPKSIYIMS
jgi:ornithine decarboxylase